MCESFLEAFRDWESKQDHGNFMVQVFSDGSGDLINKWKKRALFHFDDVSELIEFFRKD